MRHRTAGVLSSILLVSLGVSVSDASGRHLADPDPQSMLAAMQRDLHLTAEQAAARHASEAAASGTERDLREHLGTGFGGAWLDEDGQRLIVAITDERLAAVVRAKGAEPRLVTRNATELDALKAKLDKVSTPSSVTSWYVDIPSNTVVIETLPGASAVAQSFAGAAGVDTATVRVEAARSRPVPFNDVRGGDKFYRNGGAAYCAVGFSVAGGFVTAGHCGAAGDSTWMSGNGVELMGRVIGSTFPGKDYGWVDVEPGWTPRPVFKFWSGYLSLHGADVAAVGATVCRSGPTTGWRCGKVKARNVTVNFEDGLVHGLTRTGACANHGDSGGPFVFGGQAQGVLSGGVLGDDPCLADTFFQPVRPILANYRLNLLVAGGSVPTVTGMSCDYHGSNNWGCNLSYVAQGSAQITWKVGGVARPAWDDQRVVSGSCTDTLTTISATIANSAASWTETRAVLCLGGGLPH